MPLFDVSEPLDLMGEGEYNLIALKEIKITDSYLGINQNVRKCQNEEILHNCTTRHYLDDLLDICGCLPFSINLSKKVLIFIVSFSFFFSLLANSFKYIYLGPFVLVKRFEMC